MATNMPQRVPGFQDMREHGPKSNEARPEDRAEG